ncbi:PBSX family phage terminase large subunit [Brachybacterium alimentarium]|uniref:PBSX family phage terminase large subunit n=1 Tax=Brachybacterium alimentarium TaxID=47845 RepID=UPI003FD45F7C
MPLPKKALHALANPSPSIEAYEGSVRSGKTILTIIDWIRFIRNGPAGTLAMCGRTERTVINNIIIPMQEMLGRKRVQIKYGTGTAVILGREVHLYGANNEQARTKIQGLTLAGALVDEAGTLPESFMQMLYSRLSVIGAKLWLTANPEGPQHWLKTKWLDRARLWIDKHGLEHWSDDPNAMDLHRYTFVLEDNPALPPDYVERIKRAYTGMWRKRYIDAEWVVAEGAVYSSWDPTEHVVAHDELPRLQRVFSVGLDHGTTNPTAALALALGEDDLLYVVDELRIEDGPSDGVMSGRLRTWLRRLPMAPEWLVIDPAAASFKVKVAEDGITNVMNGENDVLYGIRTVSSLLEAGQLRISDRCHALITEIPGYAWSPKATEKGLDAPIKANDHSCDALRYAIATTETLWRPYLDAPT